MGVTKLNMSAFSDADCSSSLGKSIDAFINPNEYSQNFDIRYEKVDVIGDSNKTLFFSGMESSNFSLKKLVVDGTGIVKLPSGITTVEDYIKKLASVVYKYDVTLHKPPYVKITWGQLTFKGVCTSFNVNYTLFDTQGKALRATIDIDFKSSSSFVTKEQATTASSPDLTHFRVVQAGDTIPLMTYRIYGDSTYYLEVAKANNLKHINAIKPGDQIYFPPLKK